MGLLILIIAAVSYFGSTQVNPVTGEEQRVAISPEQEVILGLQAAPAMAAQYQGAEQGPDAERVKSLGRRLVINSEAINSPYKFEFHLLRDRNTVNAFALPGGQIFITRALYDRLTTEGQLAGVLGHEIGHVIERHSAEQMAKSQFGQSIVGAAAAATDGQAAGVTQYITQFTLMKYGREDELESDRWGIKILVASNFDPRELIQVMRVLEEASGGNTQPEWASTHPNPGNRIQQIEEEIQRLYPNGIPSNPNISLPPTSPRL